MHVQGMQGTKMDGILKCMLGKDCKRELVAHQLDSFDDFVSRRIADVVHGFNPIRLHSDWKDDNVVYSLDSTIDVCSPRLSRPSACEHDGTVRVMTPDVARARHFTYAGDLVADITISVRTTRDSVEQASFTRIFPDTKIGRIPVMVYSSACVFHDPATRTQANMCPHDPGGYFIVGGNERVVVPQVCSHPSAWYLIMCLRLTNPHAFKLWHEHHVEAVDYRFMCMCVQDRMSENRVFVFPVNKTVSYSFGAEVRSLVSERFGVPKLAVVKISTKSNVGGHFAHVTMHHISGHVPLFIMLRALGLESDRAMYEALDGGHAHGEAICRFLAGCAHDAMIHGICSQAGAISWITSRSSAPLSENTPQSTVAMLETELLPHVGPCSLKKAMVLTNMARRAALVAMGVSRTDDRDSYVNKRVDPSGILLANLFRQCYGKFSKEVRKTLAKDLTTRVRVAHKDLADAVNMASVARPSIIEGGMRTALATGNWGVKNNAKVGVSQILSRMTYPATLSHLRRVCTSIDKTSKLVQPRKLHGSQWGVFCPAETPEGHSVGVVKNLSIGAQVTLPVDPAYCVQLILAGHCGEIKAIEEAREPGTMGALVSVNYCPIAFTADPVTMARDIVQHRRSGALHAHSSVVFDRTHREVRVLMDGGRMVRPLLVVRDGCVGALQQPGSTTWSQMVLNGHVEYLDIEEASTSFIAMSPEDVTCRHTHCEIHPSLALGVLASMIPFPDHNQSPRNSYQSAMGKQAIGVYATNFRYRFDTHAMTLDYAQRPMVSSMLSDILHLDSVPCGTNLIVAVSTMAGYNQEDSVVLNQSSLERGMFATTVFHTIYEQVHKNPVTGEEEKFYAPTDNDVPLTTFNFDKLLDSGFPPLESKLSGGDVVIGKCMPQKGGGYVDESVALRTNEGGKLDTLISAQTHGKKAINGDGYGFCQVRLRDSRTPTIGDKVASRAGQVCHHAKYMCPAHLFSIAYVRKKWTLISALRQHCVALAICICSDPAEQASCRLHAPYREASDTLWVTKSDVPLETCWPAVMMVCEVQVYLVTHHTQHAQKKFGSADCGLRTLSTFFLASAIHPEHA